MSVKAIDRAWDSGAGGNDLLVLLALADHAGGHTDAYADAYPSVKTIAEKTRVSPRTVQRCLRSLEDAGHILKTGEHHWGRGKFTTIYRVTTPDDATGRQPDGGDKTDVDGATPVSPKPSNEPAQERKKDARASAPEDEFPEDLPEHLQTIALAVGRLLKKTALQRGQRKPVTRAAVGHALLTFPDHDHVKVAREVEHWLLHGRGVRKPCADIVTRYRKFLDNSDPAAGPPLPAGVTPMHGPRPGGGGRRLSNAEQVDANIAALEAAEARLSAEASDTFGIA